MALNVQTARAEVVFASGLQASDKPTAADVKQAIVSTVRTYRSRGCTELVAQEFGDHPELAAPRMAWARQTVLETFPKRGAR